MRFYAIGKNRLGHPYIEAVAIERHMLEDATKELFTREAIEADPVLRIALQRWEAGDDRLIAVEKSWWALKENGRPILEGIQDIQEAAEVAGDVDDFYCDSVRRLAPVLEEARGVLGSVLDEMERDERARLAAEDGPSVAL